MAKKVKKKRKPASGDVATNRRAGHKFELVEKLEAGIELEGASDHGVSEAIYLRDPDGNGVELYRDRPRVEWPRDAAGTLAMGNRRFDLHALLAELR